jgi:hypothetical protein
MAEHGTLTTGKNRGEALTVTRNPSVAHCVDAAMDTPQATRFISTRDMTLGKSQLPQLPERNNAVLRFGQLRQLSM